MTLENSDLKKKISVILKHFTVKNYDKVIEEANRLLKKKPNLDILWNVLGLTYQRKGNLQRAEENFFRCLQANPNNIGAINNIGNKTNNHAIGFPILGILQI